MESNKAIERTLVLVKPSGVARGLIGEVISRMERRGLTIKVARLLMVTREMAERHYAEHKGKDFYDALVRFICSGPVVVMVVEGKEAVAVARKLIGATFGWKAEPGTIRGDLGLSNRFNLVHGSDSREKAAFEIGLYFQESELVRQQPAPWVYDLSGPEPV